MKIAIFYHLTKMGCWQDVDEQIMGKLTSSGLLNAAEIFVRNESSNPELFEFPTLHMVADFARRNNDYAILYLHTKGCSYPFKKQCIADWRECLLYFTVEKWSTCVSKLNTCDVVSINYLQSPLPHFQGNFWWATSAHIKRLPSIESINIPLQRTVVFDNRHKCEMWLMSHPNTKHCSLYHHSINPYFDINPRTNYVKF